MEQSDHIAQTFKALSHKRRVSLFNLLLANPCKPLTFGQLRHMSKIPVAPLTHHLAFLEKGGLIRRQIKGSHTHFALQLKGFSAMLSLVQTRCASR